MKNDRQVVQAMGVLLSILIISSCMLPWGIPMLQVHSAEAANMDIHSAHAMSPSGHEAPSHAHDDQLVPEQWEGSPEGIAYSEFNHAFVGLGVILVGLSELQAGLGMTSMAWARFLLPLGMLVSGAYLIIWSDHNAWPVGSLSLTETLFGNDMEILQHKIFAVLLLGIGCIELLGRLGRIRPRIWQVPLPGFAILGGLMLFMHSHGPHPVAHHITMHHTIMGVLAITAGSLRVASGLSVSRGNHQIQEDRASSLRIIWSSLILAIGVQLLLYSEG